MSNWPKQKKLMTHLGFTLKEHGYGPGYRGHHWEHKPSGAMVLLDPQDLPTAASVLGVAIASGIGKKLLELEQCIAAPISKMRGENKAQLILPNGTRKGGHG
jgi:hypothetical protein